MPAPAPRGLFLRPRDWRWGEYVSFTAVVAMLVSTLGLNWITVEVEFRDPILGMTWVDQNYDFKVLENQALAWVIIGLLLVCLVSIPWRRPVAWSGWFFCLALAGCFAFYLYALIDQAYDILGFVDALLGLVRMIPIVGPKLAEMTRQAIMDSIKSVRPQAGFYLFAAGELALIAGTALRLRRKTPVPPGPAAVM